MASRESRSGTRYSTPGVLEFVDRLHVPHDFALDEAYNAPDREKIPSIQLSRGEAKAVAMMLRLIRACKVVEVGTLAGYSTIHIARALEAGGRLWTIEAEARHVEIARRNLVQAGVHDRVEVVHGHAPDVLERVEPYAPFDAIFVDANKIHYDYYGRWAASHLRVGGLLLVDNAYLFGTLLDDTPTAASVRRLHEDSRYHFDTVCVPTPDGLLVGIRR